LRALVTGATGFVGSYLVRALIRRGDSVRILARNTSKAAALRASGVEAWVGDLAEPKSLEGIAEGMDAVFHLGSAMHGSADLFDRVDFQSTERLLAESERAGVRRFVYAGTLSGYPLAQMGDDSVIDEKCPFDDTGLLGNYARTKARCEEAVLAANARGKLEGVVVRLGLVCGIGANIFPAHVCKVINPKWAILFGDGRIPLPLTFVDNAVDALILGATEPGIGGESFNIVDDDVLTQLDYLDLVRQFTGTTPRVLRLPRLAYYAIGVLTELASAVRRTEPETNRYRIRTRLTRVRWDCSKAKRLLHWKPQVRLRVGLSDTFGAYVKQKAAKPEPAKPA
jgi:nucleoside-diphosphate-sugar epimerase